MNPTRARRAETSSGLALAVLIAVSSLALACGGSGGGKQRTILLSTEYHDITVGADASREIEAEMGIYDDPTATAFVAEVGQRLVAHAPLRPFQYSFKIVDQRAPNAFALPGGHIYVSRGLLSLANSEAELAGVLGHEIIHAAERHASAQQELARRTSPLLMPYIRMARLAGYSRDHERAADRGGQEIAAKAGYDPGALAEFLKRLGDVERLTIGYSRLPSYFATHPGTTERVASTATHHLEWSPARDRPITREAYIRKIEGLVLDTNPAEGIFRETEFIHPDLDFRILFPHGWALINTHQAVGALSPDGDARIFITLEAPIKKGERLGADAQQEGGDEEQAGEEEEEAPELVPARPGQTDPDLAGRMPSAEEAANRFAEDQGDEFEISVDRRGVVQIGELEAPRIDFHGSMGGIGVAGQVTFIPHRDFVFRVMSVAISSAWSQYIGRAHTTVRTFRPLTEKERRSVTEVHLRLVRAIDGEDIAGLSQRTRNAWGPSRTAVLNGVFVDTRLEEGDLIKIAYAVPYISAPPPLPEGVEAAENESSPSEEPGQPELEDSPEPSGQP